MTTEASTKRDMERRELLKELMRKVHVEEEKRDDPTFLFKLERAMSEYLQQRRHNTPLHDIGDESSFFSVHIFNAIWDFSGSQIENDALVAELLLKVVQTTTLPFRSELQTEVSIE